MRIVRLTRINPRPNRFHSADEEAPESKDLPEVNPEALQLMDASMDALSVLSQALEDYLKASTRESRWFAEQVAVEVGGPQSVLTDEVIDKEVAAMVTAHATTIAFLADQILGENTKKYLFPPEDDAEGITDEMVSRMSIVNGKDVVAGRRKRAQLARASQFRNGGIK
jgi:hypothetical protein